MRTVQFASTLSIWSTAPAVQRHIGRLPAGSGGNCVLMARGDHPQRTPFYGVCLLSGALLSCWLASSIHVLWLSIAIYVLAAISF